MVAIQRPFLNINNVFYCNTTTVFCFSLSQGAQGPSGPPGPAGARGMPVCILNMNSHTCTCSVLNCLKRSQTEVKTEAVYQPSLRQSCSNHS